MSEGDKMIIEDKAARLEAFEKMLDFVRKNYEDSLSKMEELKAAGKIRLPLTASIWATR